MPASEYNPEQLELIQTADGSLTLFNPIINERYHSKHGAKAESEWVFIKQGLNYLIEEQQTLQINILEIGFGTGLNAWLTSNYIEKAKASHPEIEVHYTGLETFPLPENVWEKLNYTTTEEEKNEFKKIHTSPWNEIIALNNHYSIEKVHQGIREFNPRERVTFNLIYFDAFAPEKQPEMWETEVFEKIYSLMDNGAALVTYCAKGVFKRNLKAIGYEVQSLQGPPFKKEMVRAIKI